MTLHSPSNTLHSRHSSAEHSREPAGRHTNRVVQASKRWNGGVADGTTSEQRGGLSVQAKKNEVEGDLVRELVRAAIAEQTRRQAAPLRGIKKRRRTDVATDGETRPK